MTVQHERPSTQRNDGEPGRTLSAVLVPLFRDTGGHIRVLLVQRGARGIHGGQLGFPGGRHEPEDASLLDTALRETEEEVGLGREGVEILTPLEAFDTRTSGFRVHPYLARITLPSHWRLADGEIIGVLTPTLQSIADPTARTERELSFPTWPGSLRVPCVILEDEHLLWGLTLRVLDTILPRVLGGEWAV